MNLRIIAVQKEAIRTNVSRLGVCKNNSLVPHLLPISLQMFMTVYLFISLLKTTRLTPTASAGDSFEIPTTHYI